MKLSIIVPVYNEARTISELIRRVKKVDLGFIEKEIIIIDDGSTDGTREILKTITGVRCIFHKRNIGKGGAVRTGFNNATGDILIIQDADLEYDPNDYLLLLQPILDGHADVVFGSRLLTTKPHRVFNFHHYLANKFLTFLSNLLTNLNLSDMETCYKVFSRAVYQKIGPLLKSNRFGIEPELTARVAKLKVRVCEVGISYYGRSYEEGKKIKWHDGLIAIWHIFRFNLLPKFLSLLLLLKRLTLPVKDNFLKNQVVWIVLAAIMAGFLYIGPPTMLWRHYDNSGEPFVLAQLKTYRDELYTYLPRAREVYDGHFPPAELSLDEQRPTILNALPPLLFSGFIFSFKGNINLAYLAAQFFFSGLIFLLFYILARIVMKSKLWALLLAFIGVLTPIPQILPFNYNGFSEFLSLFVKNFIPFVRTPIDKMFLARIDDPLLTYPIYLSAIILLFIFWKNPRFITAIGAGVMAGLLSYTYFHYFVYWSIVIGVLFFISLFYRRYDIKKFLVLLASFFLTTIPYLLNYFAARGLSAFDDITSRMGGLATGRVLGITSFNIYDYMVYILLALATYFVYFKRNKDRAIIFFVLIAAMFIVWNIQVVVGYTPVLTHYKKAISPIIFIVSFALIYDTSILITRIRPKLKKIISIALIILTIFVVGKKVVNVFAMINPPQQTINYYKFPSDIVSSWDWINIELGPEPKIISSSLVTSYYLNTYTSARPYLPTAYLTQASTDEMERRLLTSNKLFGVSKDILGKRLRGEKFIDYDDPYQYLADTGINTTRLQWNFYAHLFNKKPFNEFLEGVDKEKREEYMVKLLERYDKIETSWSDIDAKWVYYGPWERQFGQLKDRGLELVYENPSVEIYKIRE